MSILNFSQAIFYIQKINLYGLANVFVPNVSSASCELTSLSPVPQTQPTSPYLRNFLTIMKFNINSVAVEWACYE